MMQPSSYIQRGTTMLEVLITIVIIATGLLGLVGLQARLQVSEMESYQRAQALVLLNDMANRIASNRNAAASYATAATIIAPLGAGLDCPTTTASQKERDIGEWCSALKGAAESSPGVTCNTTTGVNCAGAMIGGRGCVENLGSGEYMVTIAWQGLVPLSAPPLSVACGQTEYDSTVVGAACINDLCRRVVTTIVRIATL